MKVFGEILRELRTSRNISQPDLAELLGKKDRVSISNYENGKAEPKYDDLLKIADFFHVSVDYLLGRENAEKYFVADKKADDVQERFFNQMKALILSSGEKVTEQQLEHIAEFSNFIVTRDQQKK